MCQCVCVYMCLCGCVDASVWVCICVSVGVYMRQCVCVCLYVCVHVRECMRVCMHVRECMRVRMHACVLVCAYVYMSVCVCVPDLQVHDDLPLVHVLCVHLHPVHPDSLQINKGSLSRSDQLLSLSLRTGTPAVPCVHHRAVEVRGQPSC